MARDCAVQCWRHRRSGNGVSPNSSGSIRVAANGIFICARRKYLQCSRCSYIWWQHQARHPNPLHTQWYMARLMDAPRPTTWLCGGSAHLGRQRLPGREASFLVELALAIDPVHRQDPNVLECLQERCSFKCRHKVSHVLHGDRNYSAARLKRTGQCDHRACSEMPYSGHGVVATRHGIGR